MKVLFRNPRTGHRFTRELNTRSEYYKSLKRSFEAEGYEVKPVRGIKPHGDPRKDGWKEEEGLMQCPHCGRWLKREVKEYLDFVWENDEVRFTGKKKEFVQHFQINWDKLGGFYFCSRRVHSVAICELNQKRRERKRERRKDHGKSNLQVSGS